MKMLYFRLIYILILVIITIGGNTSLYYYAAVMIASIEFLNSQKAFKNLPNYTIFNVLFVTYLAFIALNRSRHFKFGAYTEGSINIAEHVFFALIICAKLLVYFHLFSNYSFRLKAIFAAFMLNVVGFMNEIFQGWLNDFPFLFFSEDARKDMEVNALGSILFLIILGLNHLITTNTNVGEV